jgi:hypothetical protein
VSAGTQDTYRDTLIVERIAAVLRFDALSARAFGSASFGPYLFVAVGLGIEYGVFDVYNYLVTGRSSFLTSPNSLAIPVMTVVGLVGLRYIRDAYADAVIGLGVEDDHADVDEDARRRFEGLVSLRLRLAAYALALVCYYAFVIVVLGVPEVVEISGIGLVLYAQLVSFPLIIVPILSELAVSYVAVHVLVPKRLEAADLGLFFYDPRNLGGFEPVGELLKRSYYIYTAILLLWFLQSHAPVLLAGVIETPYPGPEPVFQLVLTGVWVVGVLSIGYSMYRVHGVMESKKEQRLRSLEAELKAAVDDPYDANPANIADRERYDDAMEHVEQVRQTKTYPTTFAMWSQIFLSVLLPQALNMAVQLPG